MVALQCDYGNYDASFVLDLVSVRLSLSDAAYAQILRTQG